MADFRKMLYALAIVALLAAVTVPANAQGMNCTSPSGSNAAIRQGGYTELTGYFDIECETQGTSTAVGLGVKQGTLRISVSGTTLTSRVVDTSRGVTFVESLLLVDNPKIGKVGLVGQLPCGTNSNDSSPGLPGVCNIISTGNPDQTYDGTASTSCSAGFGCDRPNIFQGRQSTDTATCPVATCVEFKAVPLDPPGTNRKRTFRFTNFRVNASALAPGSVVIMTASVVDSQTAFNLPLEKRAEVGTVVASAPSTTFASNNGYTLCVSEQNAPGGSVIISEGSGGSSIWRARNTVIHRDNSTSLGAYLGNHFTNYNTSSSVISGVDDPQNDPDGGYFTESGFVFGCDGTNNCPLISSNTVLGNGLHLAGVATQGTLLAFPITANPDPTNVSITWPSSVPLMVGSTTTGFLNYYSASGNVVIYEVGYNNPFLNETATITPTISYTAIIPGPDVFGAGSAILAPYGASVNGTFNPNSSLRYPRFAGAIGSAIPDNLFSIGNCTCNLLFPWVTTNSGWTTGVAVSNTSLDPGTALGFTAVPQSGPIKLYLFANNPAGLSNPAVTSTLNPVSHGTNSVLPGNTALFVVNSANFAGYAIAQAQFQYCHGVAVMYNGGGQTASYLGLVMDKDGRTTGYGGGLGSYSSSGGQLQRTINRIADSMDN